MANLLQYLESSHIFPRLIYNNVSFVDRSEVDFFSGEPLVALSTLAWSENVDLQRSAALAFAEITEKGEVFQVHFELTLGFRCS